MTTTPTTESTRCRLKLPPMAVLSCILLALSLTMVAVERRMELLNAFRFEVDMQTTAHGWVQLLRKVGHGFVDTSEQPIPAVKAAPTFARYSFPLPSGHHEVLQLKLIDLEDAFTLANPRILNGLDKVIRRFPPECFIPYGGIDEVLREHGATTFTTVTGAADALVNIRSATQIFVASPWEWTDTLYVVGVFLLALAVFIVFTFAYKTCADRYPDSRPVRNLTFHGGAILIAGICFVLLLAGGIWRINGSSVNMLARVIGEPEVPQIGAARLERGDEWLLSTPEVMYQALKKKPFDPETSLFGPHKTALLFNVPTSHPTTLIRPQLWPFFIFDAERAYALYWQYKSCILLAGVFSLLLFITRDSLLSALGSLFFFFSSYTQWFFSTPQSMPEVVGTSCLIVVVFCSLCLAKGWVRSTLLGIAFAALSVNFALYVYPSFQIPLMWVSVGLCLAFILGNWSVVSERNFRGVRLLGITVALLLTCALMIYVVHEIREVIELLRHSNYPRLTTKRTAPGGFVSVWRYFSHFMDVFENETKFPKPHGNICESVGYIWLAPFMLFTIGAWKQLRKPQVFMLICCFAVLLIIFVWQMIPIPGGIEKMLLLNYVKPLRAWPGLGLANVLALCITLSPLIQGPRKRHCPINRPVLWVGFCLLTFAVFFVLLRKTNAEYRRFWSPWQIVAASFWLASFFFLVKQKMPRTALLLLVLPLVLKNALVNPITFGMKLFTESPVRRLVENNDTFHAGKVAVFNDTLCMEYVKGDTAPTKWWGPFNFIGWDFLSQYLGGCGVNVINAFKFVPDIDTWSRLDTDGKHLNIYNRCAGAHIIIDPTITEPMFKPGPGYYLRVHINPQAQGVENWGVDFAAFPYSPREECAQPLKPLPQGDVWPFTIYAVASDGLDSS